VVSDLDENEDSYHNWNAREEKKTNGDLYRHFFTVFAIGLDVRSRTGLIKALWIEGDE